MLLLYLHFLQSPLNFLPQMIDEANSEREAYMKILSTLLCFQLPTYILTTYTHTHLSHKWHWASYRIKNEIFPNINPKQPKINCYLLTINSNKAHLPSGEISQFLWKADKFGAIQILKGCCCIGQVSPLRRHKSNKMICLIEGIQTTPPPLSLVRQAETIGERWPYILTSGWENLF